MNSKERVVAALELREPDRVPTMDMMAEYANIYEILGRKPLPLGPLFENRYMSRVLDVMAPGPLTPFIVEKTMELFTYDRTAAAVKMGYDSAWVTFPPIWRYDDSRNMHDICGRQLKLTFDGRGNLGTPMYCGGLITDAAAWDAWPKRDLLRLPEKYHRVFSKLVKRFGDQLFIFGTLIDGIFGFTWEALGFERFVVAMRKERAFIDRMIGFYTDLYCMMIEAMGDAGCPGILYPDDMAYRSGPMLSPKQYDSLLGESFRRMTDTAHRLGMKMVIHSCGNVYQLLDWFADCGFDGVHALEPTAGVELAAAKEMLGDRICLIGNVDVTSTLVDAGRDEVFEEVRRSIDAAGRGGGYIVSPTNSHPGMTVRNLRWMLEAVEEHGRYPLS
ncbi:MAG: uroporphyrinogen decarboxylase family protein [Candidatus Geothermincolia bacterium]